MSITAEKSTGNLSGELLQQHGAALDAWFDDRFSKKLKEVEENRTPSLSIIATKGTMDWAYPPFILASTASALGWDVNVFFTFYGLELLKKDLNLQVSPLGNPGMPMKMPFGPKWFQGINWNMPNLLMAGVPGFEKLATTLMKKTVKNNGVASIQELRDVCIEAGVNLVACQMTVDLFGYTRDDFIPEVKDWIGAASFLPIAQKSDVSLFI
ncbi:NADH dehydrogenase [Sulfuricaulis limicola]|uniref:NADH dehydrogenase n=1 Tax=Sulfuricaulis limicola TaxID=1620215 RepID=A0A1B4XCC0_9GAMM|nr:DsrE/DsrF/DrsH-like family protein [Sulfuricaulis limicola]BAV32415.1 NADH dehydrogenase [Sulfuricaulis limicola]